MKIGILGADNIGATLSKRLSAAGHDVKVTPSRRPDTMDSEYEVRLTRALFV